MYERYVQLLKENHKTNAEVSRNTGIPPSTFSDWKKGKSKPKHEKMMKIANYFNVNVEWLEGTSDYRNIYQQWNHDYPDVAEDAEKIKAGVLLPVLDEVRAGIPNHMIDPDIIDSMTEWEEISPKLAKTGSFFACRIKGNSMEPKICNGDIVIVRQQPDAENGEIVIAKVDGEDECCKRLIKNQEGITLQSFNPDYAPLYFSNDDIQKQPVIIIGKVIELRRKF